MKISSKYFLIPFFTVGFISGCLGAFFYFTAVDSVEKGLQARLRNSAALVGQALDAGVLESIRGPEDAETPAYQSALALLRDLKRTNEDIAFMYIMRLEGEKVLFVVDSDSSEEQALPGDEYEEDVPALKAGFFQPSVDREVVQDQWGSYLSGYSPLRNGGGRYLVGLDMRADEVARQLKSIRVSSLVFLGFSLLLALCIGGYLQLESTTRMERERHTEEIQRESASRLELAEKNAVLERQLLEEKRLSALMGMTGQLAHSINNMAALLRQGLTRAKAGLEAPAMLDAAKSDPNVRFQLREMYDGVLKSERALSTIVEAVKRGRSAVAADYFQPVPGDLNAAISGFAFPQEVSFTPDASLPAFPFDATLLFDALSNAVANAQRAVMERAAAERGFAGSIRIETRKQGEVAEIVVADNGIGMSSEQLAKVSAPGENFTSKGGGEGVVGLGVGAIRNIARAHGGDIAYESEPGKGTTLRIRFSMEKA